VRLHASRTAPPARREWRRRARAAPTSSARGTWLRRPIAPELASSIPPLRSANRIEARRIGRQRPLLADPPASAGAWGRRDEAGRRDDTRPNAFPHPPWAPPEAAPAPHPNSRCSKRPHTPATDKNSPSSMPSPSSSRQPAEQAERTRIRASSWGAGGWASAFAPNLKAPAPWRRDRVEAAAGGVGSGKPASICWPQAGAALREAGAV